jgi:hypothetical protein
MTEIEITRIVKSFRSDLPNESKTARAIDRSAGIEEIVACTTEEGMHSLAGALFEALEEQGTAPDAAGRFVLGALEERIREFRKQLPANSLTADGIDRGAPLEEISECAAAEGLTSFAAMLEEAEQEQLRGRI